MLTNKKDIIAQLKKDILQLQGFKTATGAAAFDHGLGPIADAFPQGIFPAGAVHEFISHTPEAAASSNGFIACLLAGLMQTDRACIWVSSARTLFPPALISFGVDPARIIFADVKKEKDLLWAMEEALKCEGLAAVIGEIKDISFTASRRLQLAVEQSRVTGFIHRYCPRNLNTIACVSRWQVTPLSSALEDELPGVGFPRWNIALLKMRNGKPGNWLIERWPGHFRFIQEDKPAAITELIRKTG